jgi:DNA-binding response OmpR family regulator
MKSILIIEDDKMVASIYRQRFAADGFKVDVAEDGAAGLARVEVAPPDMVLLDLMLPKLGGIEVLKRIRARTETAKLPVVVFSNAYLANVIQDAWDAGANAVMAKLTRTPKEVVEVVRNLLAGAAAPAPVATEAGAPSSSGDAEIAFQENLRKACREASPETLKSMQRSLHGMARGGDASDRVVHLLELYRRCHSLVGSAGVAGLHFISYAAAILEALLRELCEKPEKVGESCLRTIAMALDLLLEMFAQGESSTGGDDSQISILAVDDDQIVLLAIHHALARAQLKGVLMDDPAVALKIMELNRFDLVLLDLEMPGFDGLELCRRLRALPNHTETPVVFLTSASGLENRAQTILSGGNDFVGKPFLSMELTLKVLTLILSRRLRKAAPQP